MSEPRLDVVAIGNAIVDVISDADDAFIVAEGLTKGSMRLVDADEATRLYERMRPGLEMSGGSAANTVAGVAALGGKAGFIGQLAPDQLGEVFRHDIASLGVEFRTEPKDFGVPTARCLILVTPDAQRTMNTFLGASQHLPSAAVDEQQIRDAAILYLEGYLWDPQEPRFAMLRAIEVARSAGRKVAFTLSDTFCVERHHDGFLELIDSGRIDILFANEAEIKALAGESHFDTAVDAIKDGVELLVVTRSERGAIGIENGRRVEISAEPVAKVVDTTGAGDLFAAGLLAGRARGADLETSLRMGAIAAAEVISHYGARPEADLRKLMAATLG